MICAEPGNKTVGEFISVGSVSFLIESRLNELPRLLLYIVSRRNKKVKDPTLFTENSTKLEASVCRLTLPEVRESHQMCVS